MLNYLKILAAYILTWQLPGRVVWVICIQVDCNRLFTLSSICQASSTLVSYNPTWKYDCKICCVIHNVDLINVCHCLLPLAKKHFTCIWSTCAEKQHVLIITHFFWCSSVTHPRGARSTLSMPRPWRRCVRCGSSWRRSWTSRRWTWSPVAMSGTSSASVSAPPTSTKQPDSRCVFWMRYHIS